MCKTFDLVLSLDQSPSWPIPGSAPACEIPKWCPHEGCKATNGIFVLMKETQ